MLLILVSAAFVVGVSLVAPEGSAAAQGAALHVKSAMPKTPRPNPAQPPSARNLAAANNANRAAVVPNDVYFVLSSRSQSLRRSHDSAPQGEIAAEAVRAARRSIV
jgi:hypothetical protein